MALFDEVKADLGITKDKKDSTIKLAISMAEKALHIAGVDNIQESDDNIKSAIFLYCRAWFNYQGDKEYYQNRFDRFANTLADTVEYGDYAVENE